MNMKLYNLFFPLWMLLLIPKFWITALPAIFILNTLVFIFSMKILKQKNIVENYKKVIVKLWLFNFVGIIVGSLVLLCLQMITTQNTFISNIVSALAYNPFDNIFAIIITLICIFIGGITIYSLNSGITFKDVKIKKKKKLVIIISIFTAPYLFFYPAEKIYTANNLQNEILLSKLINEFSGDTLISRIFAESQNYTNTEFKYIDKIAKVDSDIVESSKGSIVNMKISTEFDVNTDRKEYEKWAKQCSIIVFIKQPNIDEVVVNLSSDTRDVCKLTYTKENIEKEFGISISELEHDNTKLQKVLNDIIK